MQEPILKLFDPYKNLHYAFSQIKDGNMSFMWQDRKDVIQNREKFFHNLNLDIKNAVMMSVQHGTDVSAVKKSDLGKGMRDISSALKVDALMTDEPNTVLCLLTADCLPIIFFDPNKRAIALAHAGWQGTEGKLSQKVIKKMYAHYDSDAKDILVAIGPGIHKESYKYWFGEPPMKKLPGWQPFIEQSPDNLSYIDIVGYNVHQLTECDIPGENIAISHVDTAKSSKFYSHLRSVKHQEPEGRFMTVVSLIDSNSPLYLGLQHACRKDFFVNPGFPPVDDIHFE